MLHSGGRSLGKFVADIADGSAVHLRIGGLLSGAFSTPTSILLLLVVIVAVVV